MRLRTGESSTNYAGRRRSERFGFGAARLWSDRRRTKIGGRSEFFSEEPWFGKIYSFKLKYFPGKEKTHAKTRPHRYAKRYGRGAKAQRLRQTRNSRKRSVGRKSRCAQDLANSFRRSHRI